MTMNAREQMHKLYEQLQALRPTQSEAVFDGGDTTPHMTGERGVIVMDRRMAIPVGALMDQFELPFSCHYSISMNAGLKTYNDACMAADTNKTKVGPACLYLMNAFCLTAVTQDMTSKPSVREEFAQAVLKVALKGQAVNMYFFARCAESVFSHRRST